MTTPEKQANRQFDFARALSGEIKNAPASTPVKAMDQTQPEAATQPTPAKSERKKKRSFIGKVMSEIGLSIGRPFRKFLLNNVHEKLDMLLQGLQRQEARTQHVESLLESLLERQLVHAEQISAMHSQLTRNHESTARQIRGLDAHWTGLAESMSSRIDDLTIKARGPILLDDQSLAIRTVDGFVVAPREDHQLVAMLIDASVGGLEPGTRKVIQEHLRPGATFIDVGAHIGLLSLAAARVVGTTGRVFSFEAVPKTFGYLQQTIEINQLSDLIVLHNEVVSSGRSERLLHVRPVLGHSSLFSQDPSAEAETIRVSTNALDDLIPAGIPVDLIKIDVEGAEIEVLQGMTRLLGENPRMGIVAEFGTSHLALSHQSIEQWFDAFRSRGFVPFVIDELTGRLDMLFHDKQRDVPVCNILFLPPVRS